MPFEIGGLPTISEHHGGRASMAYSIVWQATQQLGNTTADTTQGKV